MKVRKSLVTLAITLTVSIIFGLCGFFNVFEKLDLRFYDALLHLKKDPPVNEKIVLVAVDEIDIDKLGDWPWTRNILADTIIRMKEFNTRSAVFDIEYISPSLKSVVSNAEDRISNRIYETEQEAQNLMRSIPKFLERGYPASELSNATESLINEYLFPSFTGLYQYVQDNVSFDNDEYFGKAVQFFGNTFLTVNNQDLGYSSITEDDINYIKNRFLNLDFTDPKGYTKRDNDFTFLKTYDGIEIGFTPALHSMMARANGAGFTNSNVDEDGTRRRMELFYNYGSYYLPQLVMAPLLQSYDTKEIVRTKHAITLKNALIPSETERRDIKIPLDNHGQMLINWQHEESSDENKFYGFNYEHVYAILQLDLIEKNIMDNLEIMQQEYVLIDEEGYPLDYIIECGKLIDDYKSILEYKNFLLEKCTGYDIDGNVYDGISEDEYELYFGLRSEWFKNIETFIQANHIAQISELLNEPIYDDLLSDFTDLFNTIKDDYENYNTMFIEMKNKFENAYCIIGMTAASTTDIGAIPFNKQYANVGIHANIMNTILTEKFLQQYEWYWGFGIAFIICLLGLLFVNLSNSLQNIFSAVLKILLIIGFVLLFVLFDIYIPMMGTVILYSVIEFIVQVANRYLKSSREKRFITQIASSFANKDTVEELRKNPDAFKTEGQKKSITALFSDIQKFSTFSENITKIYGEQGPNRLIALLNEYLGQMSNEILVNRGNIDKYEGDAIISMFGAPDPTNIHTKEEWAYNCLDSAIRMKKVEEEFCKRYEDTFRTYDLEQEDGTVTQISLNPFQTRIGINSGEAYVGLMGSKTESFSKLNYTMIGDSVNLAARLEGVNKAYYTWIMCSDETWNLANTGANEGKIAVRALDKVRVVGRSTPVQLYNVLGYTSELTEEKKEEMELFDKGMVLYLDKKFKEAEKVFTTASQILGDKTCRVFAERCKNYLVKGVPEDWDGVMNLTSK